MKILKDFKKFAVRGNAIDLAVGVVIGAAFGKIVSSLVEDIINPLIGLLTGNIDFTQKVLALNIPIDGVEPIVLRYGIFVTAVINFIIVAFSIFIVVHHFNKIKDKDNKNQAAAKQSEEAKLLIEIRDLLSKK